MLAFEVDPGAGEPKFFGVTAERDGDRIADRDPGWQADVVIGPAGAGHDPTATFGQHTWAPRCYRLDVAILLTIVFELHGIKDLPPDLAGLRVALAAGTILLSWFFMNTIFALYYAHGYYGDADPSSDYKPTGGLVFPGRPAPDYWDFLYFSFVVGMTFQVSDVQIEDHTLRRGVLAHGVLAFFFNVIIVALTINIVAGLI